MKALVFHGADRMAWEDVAKPGIVDETDAIVRVEVTTICGTDLHILKGDVPAMVDGRIIGHEAVGTVEEVGRGVKHVAVGDRVLVSCVSACGTCRFCRQDRSGQCLGGGGWILGNTIDGTQAEYVRVPFADNSTYPVPAGVNDEDLLMLADILPTGYEVGVLNGNVRPGDVVAVVGAGPIGLSALTGAKLFSPSLMIAIDLAPNRLEAAKQFGADVVINNSTEDAIAAVGNSPAGSVPTLSSKPSACQRPSSSPSTSCGRSVASRTSASTGNQPPSTWNGCGIETSPSPRALSTPVRPGPC